MEMEAQFYESLTAFQDIYSRCHELMISIPINQQNSRDLSSLIKGLETLSLSLDAIAKTYPALCEAKGVQF